MGNFIDFPDHEAERRIQAASQIREAIRSEAFEELFLAEGGDILWEVDYSGSTCMHFACYFMLSCHFEEPVFPFWKWILTQAAGRHDNFGKSTNSKGQSAIDIYFQSWLRPSYQFRHSYPLVNRLPDAVHRLTRDKILQKRLSTWILNDMDFDTCAVDSEDEDMVILAKFWRSLEMLTRVAKTGSLERPPRTSMLHLLASFSHCPGPVAEMAVALFPEKLLEYDENGCLPLHCWAMSTNAREETNEVVPVLLHSTPATLSLPCKKDQRLPIHIVAASTRPISEVQTLWHLCPQMLDDPSPVEGLPCFALLACDATHKDSIALDRSLAVFCASLGSARMSSVQAFHKERLELQRLSAIFEALRYSPSALPQVSTSETAGTLSSGCITLENFMLRLEAWLDRLEALVGKPMLLSWAAIKFALLLFLIQL